MQRQTDRLAALTLEAQQRIFRLAERDHGLSLKAISLDSGIHYDTLRAYARRDDTAAMPVTALLKLCDVLPDHLLSHLLDPVGRHLTTNDHRDGDLSDLGREAAKFTHDWVDAASDGNVTPIERAKLVEGARRLGGCASNVVGGAAA